MQIYKKMKYKVRAIASSNVLKINIFVVLHFRGNYKLLIGC